MRIIVVVGRVLDPQGISVNRRRGLLFVNREEYLMQPADRCALEAALRISDVTGAEVVALPRSPLPDDDVLRQALATGADRAVNLVGDSLAGADDAAMTRVLVAALERLGETHLVLMGATTLDSGQSQLGPRLAEALDWPQILNSWRVEVLDGRVRSVQRRSGEHVTVEGPMPAVVTVAPGALKARYPNGARLVSVYKDQESVEKWDVSDLVDETALQPSLQVRGNEFPPERERGTRLDGTAEEMARELAELIGRKVLQGRRG